MSTTTLRGQNELITSDEDPSPPTSLQIPELSSSHAQVIVAEFTGLQGWEPWQESGHLVVDLFSWLWDGVDDEEGIGAQIVDEWAMYNFHCKSKPEGERPNPPRRHYQAPRRAHQQTPREQRVRAEAPTLARQQLKAWAAVLEAGKLAKGALRAPTTPTLRAEMQELRTKKRIEEQTMGERQEETNARRGRTGTKTKTKTGTKTKTETETKTETKTKAQSTPKGATLKRVLPDEGPSDVSSTEGESPLPGQFLAATCVV